MLNGSAAQKGTDSSLSTLSTKPSLKHCGDFAWLFEPSLFTSGRNKHSSSNQLLEEDRKWKELKLTYIITHEDIVWTQSCILSGGLVTKRSDYYQEAIQPTQIAAPQAQKQLWKPGDEYRDWRKFIVPSDNQSYYAWVMK